MQYQLACHHKNGLFHRQIGLRNFTESKHSTSLQFTYWRLGYLSLGTSLFSFDLLYSLEQSLPCWQDQATWQSYFGSIWIVCLIRRPFALLAFHVISGIFVLGSSFVHASLSNPVYTPTDYFHNYILNVELMSVNSEVKGVVSLINIT